MDDKEVTPLLFANKVIHKFVDNLLGRDIDATGAAVIRVTFRNCGGSWEHILGGDPVHVGLLIKLIQAWGMANPKSPPNQNQEVFAHA